MTQHNPWHGKKDDDCWGSEKTWGDDCDSNKSWDCEDEKSWGQWGDC